MVKYVEVSIINKININNKHKYFLMVLKNNE